jgi:intein/homing endonuclease
VIISKYSNKPVVAGGLIETKEEVMQALSSGATCISTTKKEIWEIKSPIFDELKTTENHRFYVVTKIDGDKNNLTKPYWKECKDLTSNDYLGVAINQNSIIPKWDGIDFKWGDGRKTRHKNELSKYMDNLTCKLFFWSTH